MNKVNWDAKIYDVTISLSLRDVTNIIRGMRFEYQVELICDVLADGNDQVMKPVKEWLKDVEI